MIPSMFKSMNKSGGFTLAEVVLALGIISILFGFVTVNLGRVTRTTSAISVGEILISDLRTQQEKAMNGAGGGFSNYGIYFEQDRYTLFRNTYLQGNASNVIVRISDGINLSNIDLPQNTALFASRSGEVVNYSPVNNSISVQSAPGSEIKTLRINKYGSVDEFN